jgi:hypothetical protein
VCGKFHRRRLKICGCPRANRGRGDAIFQTQTEMRPCVAPLLRGLLVACALAPVAPFAPGSAPPSLPAHFCAHALPLLLAPPALSSQHTTNPVLLRRVQGAPEQPRAPTCRSGDRVATAPMRAGARLCSLRFRAGRAAQDAHSPRKVLCDVMFCIAIRLLVRRVLTAPPARGTQCTARPGPSRSSMGTAEHLQLSTG